jgi:uncharacterized membrane protein YkvA (DUF1232 family)
MPGPAILTWFAVAAGLWLASWVVMVVLAHRLPSGLLRDVASFLPACVTTARNLRGEPAVPRRAKAALLVAVLWVLSPIDLLPEFLPVIGPLDDVVAVVLLLRCAARSIPRAVLVDAWPADPALLERMIDGRRRRPTPGDSPLRGAVGLRGQRAASSLLSPQHRPSMSRRSGRRRWARR